MINLLQHTSEPHTVSFDINKALKTVTTYAWVSAGVFFLCYIYVVGAITFSVVKERGLQQETTSLVSSIGQEELRYLSLQKTLTENYALALGFVPAQKVAFTTPQQAIAWNVGN
ncbi:MAG TPA: hypothetical protein VG621_02315 [Candidatus Paceibacterota bacterium]|nr:hypothetical protein [Candidatus Paceibacterota bacterium]